MDILEKVENFLNEWKLYDDTYDRYKYTEEEELSFEEELSNLLDSIDEISQPWLTYVGGFESPGYSISCNVLTFLYKGKIQIYRINFEI